MVEFLHHTRVPIHDKYELVVVFIHRNISIPGERSRPRAAVQPFGDQGTGGAVFRDAASPIPLVGINVSGRINVQRE